jgi:hypothetical protein
MEWWFQKPNQNLLKGQDDQVNEDGSLILPDAEQRAGLPLSSIRDFLLLIPEARKSFMRIFPSLTLEEQERLLPIYQYALRNKDFSDYLRNADNLQKNSMRRIPVRYPR